jgi:hypothetical protein
MNSKGKQKQVLFEDAIVINNLTGEREIAQHDFIVWTDKNMEDVIRSVEGIVSVRNTYSDLETNYTIVIDPRYDISFVKSEVEAAIILHLGEI